MSRESGSRPPQCSSTRPGRFIISGRDRLEKARGSPHSLAAVVCRGGVIQVHFERTGRQGFVALLGRRALIGQRSVTGVVVSGGVYRHVRRIRADESYPFPPGVPSTTDSRVRPTSCPSTSSRRPRSSAIASGRRCSRRRGKAPPDCVRALRRDPDDLTSITDLSILLVITPQMNFTRHPSPPPPPNDPPLRSFCSLFTVSIAVESRPFLACALGIRLVSPPFFCTRRNGRAGLASSPFSLPSLVV